MASAIIEIMQENGECLPQDLNVMGFTPDEVSQHWHLAKSLAVVELRLMGKKPLKLAPILGGKKYLPTQIKLRQGTFTLPTLGNAFTIWIVQKSRLTLKPAVYGQPLQRSTRQQA